MNPRIGDILHVGYPPAVSNGDILPCRAAIVTGIASDDRVLVTIFPVFNAPYGESVTVWHHPQDCTRHGEHLHFVTEGWRCPRCGWTSDAPTTERDPIDAVEAYRG